MTNVYIVQRADYCDNYDDLVAFSTRAEAEAYLRIHQERRPCEYEDAIINELPLSPHVDLSAVRQCKCDHCWERSPQGQAAKAKMYKEMRALVR